MTQIKILLAENNREQQHRLLLALARGRRQMNVTVVDTGLAFLRAVRLEHFDCAILDFHLRDYRADKLVRAADDYLHDCPTLVIASRKEQETVVRDMRNGEIDFIRQTRAEVDDELWRWVEHVVSASRKSQREWRRVERHQRKLARLDQIDPLTGFYRRRCVDRIQEEERWKGDRIEEVSCALLDIDRFQKINTTFGHQVGDRLLQGIARTVREHTAGREVTVRWGGDKILVLKPSSSLLDAWMWAEARRQTIEAQVASDSTISIHATVSFGVSHCSGDQINEGLISQAEEALELAKDQGRNAICTTDMVTLERELRAVEKLGDIDPEQRRVQLLRRLRPQLGPTQWQHTTSHCEQVSELAVQIGQLVSLDTIDVERIRLAGLMHDIGKCVIPEELLAKPRTLSFEEWQLMARHDEYGAWITSKLGLDEITTRYIRDHHTRYDAQSSDANQTPLGARILCVADALVTMRSKRSYREARTIRTALEELVRERGRQFDPAVVDATHSAGSVSRLLAA